MNPLGLLFFSVTSVVLLTVSRKWAPVPLFVGCCYLTIGQSVELGSISLPAIRLLLAVGVLRVVLRGERPAGGINLLDRLMLAFSGWIIFAGFFHNGVDSGPLYAAGVVFNVALVYFLMRVFCRTTNDLEALVKAFAVIFILVAVEMIQEKITGKNLFSMLFGGVREQVVIRNERFRARGPFRHAILAGTVGAVCFPLMIALRKRSPKLALTGMATTLTMVFASASSGPIMSLLFAIGAMALWPYRRLCRYIPITAVSLYLLLELLMSRPAYYIISKIDLAGGSTSWHRSRLIQSSIKHLSEWWLFGTDYTRHWMPSGITFSKNHTDITNYYLGFGVMAGLPAVALMIAMLWVAFRWVGQALRAPEPLLTPYDRWLIWCLSAGLVAHAATSVSVAYYDQSFVFFWFNLAVISSLHSVLAASHAARSANAARPPRPMMSVAAAS